MSQANASNLIWIDLEMTGLDTDTDSILEIATVVTNKHLDILEEGPVFAIHHELDRLEAMGYLESQSTWQVWIMEESAAINHDTCRG